MFIKNKMQLIVYSLIFTLVMTIASGIYHFLDSPIGNLEIPLPNGSHYNLVITGKEFLELISNAINNIEIKYNNTEELNIVVNRLNKIIEENKQGYLFYYDEFQKIYPERYFILCTQYGCGYYYFSVSGLLSINREEITIERPLIILIDKEFLDKILDSLEKEDINTIEIFKEGLIKGKVRVKNFNVIAERILERYGKH